MSLCAWVLKLHSCCPLYSWWHDFQKNHICEQDGQPVWVSVWYKCGFWVQKAFHPTFFPIQKSQQKALPVKPKLYCTFSEMPTPVLRHALLYTIGNKRTDSHFYWTPSTNMRLWDYIFSGKQISETQMKLLWLILTSGSITVKVQVCLKWAVFATFTPTCDVCTLSYVKRLFLYIYFCELYCAVLLWKGTPSGILLKHRPNSGTCCVTAI